MREVGIRARKLTREIQTIVRSKNPTSSKLSRNSASAIRRKKDEVERDRLREKKKLEFLLNQTEIFAHFMSNKLGLETDNDNKDENNITKDEMALKATKNYINEQRNYTSGFNGAQ